MASAWFEINLLLAERGRGRLRIVRLAIVAIVAIKSNAKYYIMGVMQGQPLYITFYTMNIRLCMASHFSQRNYSKPVLFQGYYNALSLPSLVLTCNWMFSLLHSRMHAEFGGVVWPTGTLFIYMFHLYSIYLYRTTNVSNLCLYSPAGSVPGNGRGVATSSTTFAPLSLSS